MLASVLGFLAWPGSQRSPFRFSMVRFSIAYPCSMSHGIRSLMEYGGRFSLAGEIT